jgi:HSP20 family protein
MLMRYRRLSHRYAVLFTAGQPGPFGEHVRFEQFGVRLAQTKWRPPTDVYESARGIEITIELAGIEPEELDILLFDDALVIEGKRHLPPGDPAGIYHTAEVRQGPFRLEIPLPAVIDQDRFDAQYERGLLRLAFEKVEGR